jgi:hypothetical protein
VPPEPLRVPDSAPEPANDARGPLREDRVAAAAGVVLLGAGIGLGAAETPLWWFGGALALSGLVLLLRVFAGPLAGLAERLKEPRRFRGFTIQPHALLVDLSCMAALSIVATLTMKQITLGERPVSHDHTIHYVKAWLLHEQFLPRGRIIGWSHDWFAGFPFGYLYPPGADLWVNAVHALSFGALTFSQAYGIAFWLFHVFTGISVYLFGRLVGGPGVGFVAGLLCITDLGFFRMGGFSYTVDYGVWPQALSLNFSLMALCSLPGIVERRGFAPIAAFAVWMALSIVTHPIQLIFLLELMLTAALAAGFAHSVRALSAVVRLASGCALSVVVAAFWLLPFLTSRGETNSMGVWWDTSYEMGKGLLDLTLFRGTLGYTVAFGAAGALVMLRTRQFMPLFCALTALFVPMIGSSTLIDEFHLTFLSQAFSKLQFIRLATMVKPFWFVLAAYFFIAVLTRARTLTLPSRRVPLPREDSHAQAALLCVVVGLLTVPVLVPAAQAFFTRHVHKTLVTESTRQLLPDRLRVEHWLRTSLPKDGFYRVGVFTGHNHDMMDLAPVIGRPIYKRGFTPASNFVYQMDGKEPTVLEAVNLRFAISKVSLPPDEFDVEQDFGRYRVYRFKRWQPEPFQILEGGGDVKVERFGAEEIVLRAGPGAHGKLRLNVSYFSRWRAYRDGKPVPITLTYLQEDEEKTGFMTVALSPGLYRFAFERTLSDQLATPIALFGLLICALLVAADRARRLAWLRRGCAVVYAMLDRTSEPSWALRRAVLAVLACSAVLTAGSALALWRPKIALEELDVAIARVRFDFLEGLSRAHAKIAYADSQQRCVRQGDRFTCRDAHGVLDVDNYVGNSPATLKDYILVRCIRARPVEGGRLSITYPNVRAADAIVGYYGIERAGRLMYRRRPVDFEITVGGNTLYAGHTESDNKIHWFHAPLGERKAGHVDVTFSVRAENVSRRFFCFNAQMVDLR